MYVVKRYIVLLLYMARVWSYRAQKRRKIWKCTFIFHLRLLMYAWITIINIILCFITVTALPIVGFAMNLWTHLQNFHVGTLFVTRVHHKHWIAQSALKKCLKTINITHKLIAKSRKRLVIRLK